MMRSKGGHERRPLHWKRRGEAAAALEKKRLEEEAAALEKKRLEVEAAAALEKKRRGLYWYCVGEAAIRVAEAWRTWWFIGIVLVDEGRKTSRFSFLGLNLYTRTWRLLESALSSFF